ncbi:hypothetical protein GCM10020254_33810 [Streptomyces goshikiensis]
MPASSSSRQLTSAATRIPPRDGRDGVGALARTRHDDRRRHGRACGGGLLGYAHGLGLDLGAPFVEARLHPAQPAPQPPDPACSVHHVALLPPVCPVRSHLDDRTREEPRTVDTVRGSPGAGDRHGAGPRS